MCLVSYVPLTNNGFVLSSNRDESPIRAAGIIEQEVHQGHQLLFPRDIKGGSWIFSSNQNSSICLLNGAIDKHQHRPPYKMSRGIMLRHFFDYQNSTQFIKSFDFNGMEPFTCVIIEGQSLSVVYWTGSKIIQNNLESNKIHVWSSAPLYKPEIQVQRKKWFTERILSAQTINSDLIKSIHLSGGQHDSWNGFVMNRLDKVRTISLTQVIKSENFIDMNYLNLIHSDSKIQNKRLKFD